MLFQNQVDRLARLLGKRVDSHKRSDRNYRSTKAGNVKRAPAIEPVEPRFLMAADPIQIGGVYIEEDLGSDLHGDTFHITFQGGAEGTQLTELTIDGDLNLDGFSLGDLFFDIDDSGLGADHSSPFEIIELDTADPTATVTATVVDGSTRLVLNFTNFFAGDKLTFAIDVDEVQFFDPNETDLQRINDNFDPITSGVEFQNSHFKAKFEAPHYESAEGQDRFLNRYDAWLDQTNLPLPRDNEGGKRDRTAGAGFEVTQVPKPVSLSGFVYVDANEDLNLQNGETRLSGVELELFVRQGGSFVSTGFKTLTDAQGRYSFGLDLALEPGIYQIRESQPSGYYSVGATIGRVDGSPVGQTVAGDPDVLTQIDLSKGDSHATDLNFAENLPASIQGHVCVVTGGFDCSDSNSEKEPLAGVLIELRDESGAIVATTRTAANGTYSFDNLRAGTYSITEITPAGLLEGGSFAGTAGGLSQGPNRIAEIDLTGGFEAVDYDFCEIEPSQISGHTFYDQNNNGRRDSNETPIGNVLVALWNSQGQKVAETRTDSNGFYEFTNLSPGTYRLTEVTPADYIPGAAAAGTIDGSTIGQTDSSGDVISQIVLEAGAVGINYDFGELRAASIRGRVYVDLDGDCRFDPGETGLQGVTVELVDVNGNVLQTTITDSDGDYEFDELIPGVYEVREIQPAGYYHGGQRAGTGGGDDSQADRISSIDLSLGGDVVDYDFCELQYGSLAGTVYADSDGDCIQDPNEDGIRDVRIELLNESGTVVAVTTTDADGNYKFDNIIPGVYTVRETQPLGYLQGSQMAGTGGGDDSVQDHISAIDLSLGGDVFDYDFCEIEPGTLSGVVFEDLDFDCVHDTNERPLEGVLIELLDATGTVVASARTDASGAYQFQNLRPGQYSVRETQPLGFFHGGQTAPATGGDASQADLISSIQVGAGQDVTDANFCEVPPAEISGYVFQDGTAILSETGEVPENLRDFRDGQRTDDDTAIGGVTVQLRALTGAPIDSDRALPGFYSGEFIEVQTDANGYFTFKGIRAGSYHVYEIQPEGFEDGIDTAGTTTGYPVNRDTSETIPNGIIQLIQLSLPGADPGNDAILAVSVNPGQVSSENNFSEVVTGKQPQAPPLPPGTPEPPRPDYIPPPAKAPPLALPPEAPLPWNPLPLHVGVGHESTPTWHLSVINGGFPRGARNGEVLSEDEIASRAEKLDVYTWTVSGITAGTRLVGRNMDQAGKSEISVFDVPGATPLAGDFNGDTYDELALFIDGEWFIDINGNGRWDEEDIWIRMGTHGDQPVVGDWDGDGKDDVGVFGHKWRGDERALAAETGLPDPFNRNRVKPKNLPPTVDEAPDTPRLLKRSSQDHGRADLIDHVFKFGGGRDIAVSGDFNGDGITNIGTFRDGRWLLDLDGDGKLTSSDKQFLFGQAGDIPIVGDFDGDGKDEVGIVRGNRVIIDGNGDGEITAEDHFFLLESGYGNVIVGDFDGDGRDEPALHQSASQRRQAEMQSPEQHRRAS